jgi:hypothetical protein
VSGKAWLQGGELLTADSLGLLGLGDERSLLLLPLPLLRSRELLLKDSELALQVSGGGAGMHWDFWLDDGLRLDYRHRGLYIFSHWWRFMFRRLPKLLDRALLLSGELGLEIDLHTFSSVLSVSGV